MRQAYQLELEDARALLEAAVRKAEEIGVAETVCISDAGGYPLALYRMNGARPTGPRIAQAKAWTSACHRRATHLFNTPPNGPALPGNEAFGIQAMFPGEFAIFDQGEVIGAVGVSGGNGEQDTAVGNAALEAFERRIGAQNR
jgi:uncharacterized protein GlcG (DUF336 family)